ncbi:S41 family peptidase [Nitrincola alkalilacustris]|uniref:S41 family peptidase n=1 Tax=Nitrincola alkalilacustris TaxID=1571224 RepID=UPI00124E9696|nr:S41 family peptidase [Nitrincola alkalilacustris]
MKLQPVLKTWRQALTILLLVMFVPVPAVSEERTLPLDELRLFAEVFERIKSAYVEPVEDRKLLEDAIKGMVSGLDPHSAYLDPKAYESLQVNTSGQFGGLGLEVGLDDGFIRVIAPIDDTPAQRAGIRAGDRIIKIDDTSVQGLGLSLAVELMRGEVGTEVVLTLIRQGVEMPFEVTLTRDIIRVVSVRSRILEEGYGMIRISQFQNNTAAQLRRALTDLSRDRPLQGLILDLRNNPGGVLQSAVEVTDAFISEGLIVYTEGRIPNSELRFSARPETAGGEVPLVVLINGGSASASEIVAGALQDHRRAVIMGTDSFGKGSVQTILPISNDRAVKLTTARYFTPLGRSIQAEGVQPDLVVEEGQLTATDPGRQVKERDLSGHLEGGTAGGTSGQGAEEASLAQTDFQMYEALNLLKALNIVAGPKPVISTE